MTDDSKRGEASGGEEREKWSKNIDFIFNMAGMAIGLGNVWRFPYLCYQNGGGAFLIPYMFFVIVAAVPIVALEASLGQLASLGPTGAWGYLVPWCKGIGYASFVLLWWVNTYYPVVLAYALRFLMSSFASELPWTHCNNSWNSENCLSYMHNYKQNSTFASTSLSSGNTTLTSLTSIANVTTQVSSVQEFWELEVIKRSEGIEHMGGLVWELCFCLLAIWVMTYFSIWKGISWTSKIVYVTATLPMAMLLVVVIKGCTLEGAGDGIYYYLMPNATKLAEPLVWKNAASQVFYSYALCFGTTVALGSFNRYSHNFLRDSLLLVGLNGSASFLSGFAIFSILGFMANQQNNTTIDDVAVSGPGLVFMVYPAALSLLPAPQFWSVLFFITLILLGFDSQFVFQESLLTAIMDMKIFPTRKYTRELLLLAISSIMYITALPMLTRGGIYVFNIFDTYSCAGWCLFTIGFAECIAVAWVYGDQNYYRHFRDMLKRDTLMKMYFIICWKYITPLVTTFLLIYNLVASSKLTYNKTYVYPIWADVIGWAMAFSSVICIPSYAIWWWYNNRNSQTKEKNYIVGVIN